MPARGEGREASIGEARSIEDEWPLVGRDGELARVLGRLETTGGGVVVAGPAGAGKTRLATEATKIASTLGFGIVRAGATEATSGLMFGALSALLPEVQPAADRAETLRRVGRAIVARGAGKPVALVVDDAHLLDDLSAALCYQLSAAGAAFVLATIRSGEPVPDPIVALWKNGLAERLDLPPLGRADVDQLLNAVLGGVVAGATSHLLFSRSAGNVLFLRELVLGAVEVGALCNRAGVWQLEGPLPASARLVELIEARLVELTREERTGLELLALAEPMGLDRFERLTQAMSVLTLERRKLIRVERDGGRLEVRLVHPAYGEVLRASLSPVQAVSHRRALARDIERAETPSSDDALRLAILRLELGDPAEPGLMVEAAARALTLHDLRLAERLARYAVDVGGSFDAGLLLGQVLSLSGRAEEAEQRFIALVEQANDDARRGRLAIARLDNLCYGLGRLETAWLVADDAEANIQDPSWNDEIAAYRASLFDSSGQTGAALALALPLIERANGRALVWACAMAGMGLAKAARLDEATAISERGLEAHLALGRSAMPWSPTIHVAVRIFALTYAGYLRDAEEQARREYETALVDNSREAQWMMAIVLATIDVAQGRLRSAIRWGREGANLAREQGRLQALRGALIPLVEALALAGRADDAVAALAELDAIPVPFVHHMEADIARVRAWTAVAQGKSDEARRLLDQAAAVAAESTDLVWEAAALHGLARLGQAEKVVRRLGELADAMEGPLAPLRFAHARALVSRDARALDAASVNFEEIDSILLAAEAAADAAVAWRHAGESRKANVSDRRATYLASCCDGAKTPALSTVSAVRAALSDRELQIARLAVSGCSNKEIAKQLCLSVHTVENKLHAVYERLGLNGREELSQILAQ